MNRLIKIEEGRRHKNNLIDDGEFCAFGNPKGYAEPTELMESEVIGKILNTLNVAGIWSLDFLNSIDPALLHLDK